MSEDPRWLSAAALTTSMYADPQVLMSQTNVETILADSGASDALCRPLK